MAAPVTTEAAISRRLDAPKGEESSEHPGGWVRQMFDAAKIGGGETLEEGLHGRTFQDQARTPVNKMPLIETAASEAKMVVRTLRI